MSKVRRRLFVVKGLESSGGSRYDASGKYNTIGGMAANMIEEYTFKVEYLGSLMLSKASTGLAVVQKPLKELYLNNIRKSDTKIRAQERTIKVRPEGILMIYKDSSGGQPKHVFYEMSSIHFKDSVTFVTRKGSDKKIRGGFEPLEEYRRGSADNFFSVLDKKYYFLSDKRHPALFVCIMRRPLGVKALDCHVFVMANHKEAIQIVDIINQLQCKEEAELHDSGSRTLPYHQSAGNGVEITKLPAFRPTDHPALQTSGQRYELRDEFFRPKAYDQYSNDSRQYIDPSDTRPDSRAYSDTRSNISADVSLQPGGVTVFHNTVDDFGRPTHGTRDEVRMRHPGNRHLNTSFDDRKYLNVNTSFDEDKKRQNGNLSFDETRRPFSMFQEGYDRRAEVVGNQNNYNQRYSADDTVVNHRSSGGSRGSGAPSPSSTNVVMRQHSNPHKYQDSPTTDATIHELTSAFEQENRKGKPVTSTPANRSMSPTPKTGPKPDRNSGPPISPIAKGKTSAPTSPGWGPVASMSNLESRQEMERGKRASDPPSNEILEENSKSRPVAKVPPHLVAGVKVLPTEFKVPLRKTSPQSSPRCEDPNRYNNLTVNPQYDEDYRHLNDYPVKNNRNSYENRLYGSTTNFNNHQNNHYRDQPHNEIPYSHGSSGHQPYHKEGLSPTGYRDQPYNYNKSSPYDGQSQGNRFNDSQEWGYRDTHYSGPGYGDRKDGVRDPATGEIVKPQGLKDKEIASLVSNIYIGPNSGADTNFEKSLGYYP